MLVACADVGSTFTKVAVVDVECGELVASATHPTTIGTDVLHGLDAAVAAAGATGRPLLVCSSAGGGLRLAVVGYEELVSARAAHKVALTAGARVVHVAAGRLDGAGIRELRAARPDVVLLVGGTDGGDAEVLLHNAARLASTRLRVPVVAAGNADAHASVLATLERGGVPVVATGNVLPSIGVLDPEPARAAIREVFLRHVIGGKRLSKGSRFASLVRGATPDLVLTGVQLLADTVSDGDLAVVDIGGATTDVYSVLTPDAEREVTGMLRCSRTVEGDLGMRWSAPGVVAAGSAEGLLHPADPLFGVAARLAADPALLPDPAPGRDPALPLGSPDAAAPGGARPAASPGTARRGPPGTARGGQRPAASPGAASGGTPQPADSGWADEERLATVAATVALRRHARGGADLRAVRLVVGSGGVLRHAPAGVAARVLHAAVTDHAGGWALPQSAELAVDMEYVLAPAGLLAAEYPAAASALLRNRLRRVGITSC